jgi:hypothetical protein
MPPCECFCSLIPVFLRAFDALDALDAFDALDGRVGHSTDVFNCAGLSS